MNNLDIAFKAVVNELTYGLKVFSKSDSEIRFGSKGSLSIDLSRGMFSDFESGENGKTIKFICFMLKCGKAEAMEWLKSKSLIDFETPTAVTSKYDVLGEYFYKDADGKIIFKYTKTRSGKFFSKYLGGDINNKNSWLSEKGCMTGVIRPLYNEHLFAEFSKNDWLFITEGEKDADNLTLRGLQATCNSGGAGGFNAVSQNKLRGFKKVCLLIDNDEAGDKREEKLTASLRRIIPTVVSVKFPSDKKGYDVSDFLQDGGTAEQLLDITEGLVSNEDENSDIPQYIDITDKGKAKDTIANFKALLKAINVDFHYDTVLKDTVITKFGGINEDPESQSTELVNHLVSEANRLDMPTKELGRHILSYSKQNKRNCVEEHLQSLPEWNGISYIDSLCDTLEVAPEFEEAKRLYIRKWMLGCVKTVIEGGANQTVLVLGGNQGIGKSRFCKALATMGGKKPEYFLGGVILDTSNKDNCISVTKKFIVELAEIDATFRKSDIAALKAFITREEDEIRMPYAATADKLKRRTSFVASVNDENFLADTTGNRRYLVLPLKSISVDGCEEIAELAWAEAYARYQAGESCYFTAEESAMLESNNRGFEVRDAIVDLVLENFEPAEFGNGTWKSAAEMFIASGMPIASVRQNNYKNLKRIMKQLNCEIKDTKAGVKYLVRSASN